jgi:protein-disulfide isomerase
MRKSITIRATIAALGLTLGTATACQPKKPVPKAKAKTTVMDGTGTPGGAAAGGAAGPGVAKGADTPAAKAAAADERFKITYDPAKDMVIGAAEPLVTIVEFSDIQCPFCTRLANTLKEVVKENPNDVRVIFKHFPLPMHKDANLASQAALAANAQGKGWELHDKMFANQKALSKDQIIGYAQEIGISDIAKFRSDLDGGTYAAQVKADTALGQKFAVRSTPSFFVNGTAQRGALPKDKIQAMVDAEKAKAQAMVDAGTPRGSVYATMMANAKDKRDAPQQKQQAKPGRPDPSKNYGVPTGGRPAAGPADALVTIVEFSDFQCPFCTRVNPTIAEIKKKYPNDVRVVFRQQPLPMHKEAPGAAKAALAAAKQGKFWEMHDVLFANAKALNDAKFSELAGQIGLNVGQFDADRKSAEIAKMVTEDQAVARQFGANGTPAFFINGRFLSGAQPVDRFDALIKEEKAKAEKFMAQKGVSKGQLYSEMIKGFDKEVKAAAAPPIADNKRRDVVYTGMPHKGQPAASAPIKIVECSDFDCPFCKRGADIMGQVMAEYGDKVSFSFRNYPLPMHKNAEPAHRAAVAADKQGKFWEMHDLLFADKSKRTEQDFVAYAGQLGMDVGKFTADFNNPATAQRVKDDIAECQKMEVRGAPGFLINGRLMSGAQPFPRFKTVLDEELKKKG